MKNKTKILDITFIALFAAIIAVLSQISIPMPSGMPITVQTFAVALCGYFLGAKKGTAAIGVYILLGAAGVPVFTGMKGGFVCLFSVTGGFIWGFLALTAFCGLRFGRKPLRIASGIAGLLVCHLFGTIQFALVMGINFVQSFLTASAPYLIKDAVSVVIAFMAAEAAARATAGVFQIRDRR